MGCITSRKGVFFFIGISSSILPHFLCSSSCQSYRAVVEWLIPNASIRYRSGMKREQRGAFNRLGTGAERIIFCQQCSFFALAQDTPAESQLSGGGDRASCMASHGKIVTEVPAPGGPAVCPEGKLAPGESESRGMIWEQILGTPA